MEPTSRPRPLDTLIVGADVWTGTGQHPTADAVGIRDGRVVRVGDAADLRQDRGPGTRVLDGNGGFVMPGFIDSHVHFLAGGAALSSVQLRNAATPTEFVRRIAAFADGVEPGTWITGGAWDHQLWGGELPTREWIDEHTPGHPVWVTRHDLHMGLANSNALRAADISARGEAPAGGEIVRDPATGLPTGVLKDMAMGLVERAIPDRSERDLDRALAAAAAHAVSNGITQVHDMQGWTDLEVYRRARAADALPLRLYSVVPLSSWERLQDLVETDGRGDDRLWWGGVKAFVDGSLGSLTAWFHEPYDTDPSNTGLVVTDLDQLQRSIQSADAAGLQVIVHAIGDRANDWLLDTYDAVARSAGRRDRRLRIEHAQHVSTSAPQRFASQGVIAAMQPYHAIDDGRWAETYVGAGRIDRTYAIRTLLEAGARVAFGSDWTVAPLDPIAGVFAAVTRRTVDGRNPGGWVPSQRIGVESALRAYTRDAAYAGFSDSTTGFIGRGAYADLVILDRNPLAVDPVGLESVQVVHTMVEGETVFERETG